MTIRRSKASQSNQARWRILYAKNIYCFYLSTVLCSVTCFICFNLLRGVSSSAKSIIFNVSDGLLVYKGRGSVV